MKGGRFGVLDTMVNKENDDLENKIVCREKGVGEVSDLCKFQSK